MRLLCLLTAALVMCASGCQHSQLLVRGEVLLPDGTPAEGYYVQLGATGGGAGFATVESDGHFEVSVPTDDDPPFVGALLVIRTPDGFEVADVKLTSFEREKDLAPVRLWDPGLTISATPDQVSHLAWNPAPGGTAPQYKVSVLRADVENGPAETWSISTISTSVDLPPELTEDHPANVLVASGDVDHPCVDCTRFLARVMPKPPSSIVPLSRGASCTAAVEGGPEVPLLDRFGGPCPLTNGRFDGGSSEVCDDLGCRQAHQVRVTLPEAKPISTIVLHLAGFSEGGAKLEIGQHDLFSMSFDLASLQDYQLIHLSEPIEAQQIQITAAGTIYYLDEVAVF